MRRFLTAFLLIAATAAPVMAQRTMDGSKFISAHVLTPFNNLGAQADFGIYTISGFWDVGVSYVNRNCSFSTSGTSGTTVDTYPASFGHLDFFGEYMYRFVGTRDRRFNFYGGGGVFLGCEFIDPFRQAPEEIKSTVDAATFLYGIRARLELEFFLSDSIALVGSFVVPVNFSSQVPGSNVLYEAGLGARFNF